MAAGLSAIRSDDAVGHYESHSSTTKEEQRFDKCASFTIQIICEHAAALRLHTYFIHNLLRYSTALLAELAR